MLVAFAEAVHMRNALAAQSENLAPLTPGRNGYFLGPVEGRNFKLCSQCGLGERDRNLTENIIAMAFEEGMGFDVYHHVEVPWPATPFSLSPFADYFQTASHIYPCWDLDGNLSGLLDLPCAAAICTGVRNEKTLTAAS